MAATVAVFLFLEIILRVGLFFWFGHSKYYLFYGFPGLAGRVAVRPSWTGTGKHYKFPPNYIVQGARGQGSETASINSLGFRGPEFQPRKPKGVFRIISMGESSTFGYHNSDTGTYPFLLEQLLRQQPRFENVEVINAGFPYYNSGSIRSLLESELLEYKPDLLTLYSAYNDAGWPVEKVGDFTQLSLWFQQRSYVFLKQAVLTDDLDLHSAKRKDSQKVSQKATLI